MLAKKYRLPVQSVLKKSGQTIKSRYFLLKRFPNSLSHNRFGVIISKKVDKRSAVRNRVKRIILSSAKEFLFAGEKNSDFLIIVSPKINQLKQEGIKQEIINTFKYV